MALLLEDFDVQHEAPEPETSAPLSFDEGYTRGLADAEAAAFVRQHKAMETLVQTLSDLDISYAQARAELLGALAPLFAAILENVAPALARQGLLADLHGRICDALEADTAQALRLTLSPSDHALMTEHLADAVGTTAHLGISDELEPGQAVLAHNGDETMFDTPRVLRDIETIVAAMIDTPDRKVLHGN